jgi:carbonic anhydrase
MGQLASVQEANQRLAESFDKGELEIPPARNIAVLTCIDARIDPAKALGLDIGDAHVIRNAGGRATTRFGRCSTRAGSSGSASSS